MMEKMNVLKRLIEHALDAMRPTTTLMPMSFEVACSLPACEFVAMEIAIGGLSIAEAKAKARKANHVCAKNDDCWANLMAIKAAA